MPDVRSFEVDGVSYRAVDNGCYWELHELLHDGVWFEHTTDSIELLSRSVIDTYNKTTGANE